jgi:hypothetical protein
MRKEHDVNTSADEGDREGSVASEETPSFKGWRGHRAQRMGMRRRRPWMLLFPIGMVVARLVIARRGAKRARGVQLNVRMDFHPTATVALSLLQPETIECGRRRGLRFMHR